MKLKYFVTLECGYTPGGPYDYNEAIVGYPHELGYRKLKEMAINSIGGSYTCYGVMKIDKMEVVNE